MDGHPSPGPAEARALAEIAARVRHDLGRYLALQCRWLSTGSSLEERRAALTDDLLATARGPAGSRDALQVAAPILEALEGVGGWPADARPMDLRSVTEVEGLCLAIRALRPTLAAIRDGSLTDEQLDRAVEQAIATSDAALACAATLREIASRHG